jgi:hypothetical protein
MSIDKAEAVEILQWLHDKTAAEDHDGGSPVVPALQLAIETLDGSANEELRFELWHKTYNAALTGLLANPSRDAEDDLDVFDREAAILADGRHGKLEGA